MLLAIVLVVGGNFGYNYWQDQQRYVSTDNAFVTGALVQVASLNSGTVAGVSADLGQPVTVGQPVATVKLPMMTSAVNLGSQNAAMRDPVNLVAPVLSPINGVVVARQSDPGDTVVPGQPILTVIDPNALWVQANIDETQVGRIQPGQPVLVTVDSLGQTLPGQVVAVNRATAATFSLLPQNNTAGNFTKVTQLVPVKIAVDYGQLPLVLGSSVEVKIQVQG